MEALPQPITTCVYMVEVVGGEGWDGNQIASLWGHFEEKVSILWSEVMEGQITSLERFFKCCSHQNYDSFFKAMNVQLYVWGYALGEVLLYTLHLQEDIHVPPRDGSSRV